MKIQFFAISFFLLVFYILSTFSSAAVVLQEGSKAYIEDRIGERWDVTQAMSIGFKPEGFQYGIGKNAFTPLDDSQQSSDTASFSGNPRIIGIADGHEARAYSISKLRYHEIANTRLGTKPIVAGY
jgi:hypothetical protein